MLPQVRLLGQAKRLIGRAWQLFPSDRRHALLLYLAFQQAWVSRERLAFLFYPDVSEAAARRNLRQVLNNVKKLELDPSLEVERAQLRWCPKSDLTEFRQRLEGQDLARTLSLYRSDLAEGLAVSSCLDIGT